MATIVDKRFLPKNHTAGSRAKFIKKYKDVIKSRIRQIVDKNSIKNFDKGDKKVKINREDLDEPEFNFEPGTGIKNRIYNGNKKFKPGDRIQRPHSNKTSGGGGNGGKGEDSFEFVLTNEEFSNLFFEDLSLPDLIKKSFTSTMWEVKHAGFSRYGGPSSLNIKRTMLNALGRRAAIKNTLEEDLTQIEFNKKYPLIDDMDLRYNFKDKQEVPDNRAVMFCLMDVSGSMGEIEKDIAKRFFILLNLFLNKNYEKVDVVFIRHTEIATEVQEEEFFKSRETGGTIISSGYELISSIINERYDETWNIYIAQCTDGDNFSHDNEYAENILIKELLPNSQYFAYIEVGRSEGSSITLRSGFGEIITRLMSQYKNLQGRAIGRASEIYEVFRSLFDKKRGMNG